MESRRGRRPIRGALAGLIVGLLTLWATPSSAQPPTFSSSSVAVRDGNATLLVDGRPFFFYGAAFFYERIPAAQWRASMLALRELGFNTLDLYVPWNWHELADGDFDFDGHTNARRNLRGVLALAAELRFKLIVRPGPVIRNEWRNGGYPAWLLTRPEYGMPLHDILEGRYPATATLQNANSDDAAAQWLANTTHLAYASRWLRTVLGEFAPVADRVIAVQIDDDQGAYIDNQTWPAPHLQTYLKTLESIVRGVVGRRLPVFINTYEMKVTASAPVWAMGNWYQSDAFSIGEHDRAALEFSTGLLQTQTRYPVAMSEFGAGWLAAPEDPAPRAADPTNTTLALHTLLGLGTRGVIDFPAQDTIDPAGWEAPFANEAYFWDAALTVNLQPSARYLPTKRFGDIVREHGNELADARRLADGAIAYLTSAYDEAGLTNPDVFAIAARTQQAQRDCRARHLICDLVDLRFASDAALRRYPFVIVAENAGAHPMIERILRCLERYRAAGGRVVAQAPGVITPHNGGIADATVLVARDGAAFLDIVNYDDSPRAIAATRLKLPSGRVWNVGPLLIGARDAILLRDGTSSGEQSRRRVSQPARVASALAPTPIAPITGGTECARAEFTAPHSPTLAVPQITEDDRASDGYPRITLSNKFISVTLTPNAGARAFWFAGARAFWFAGTSDTCVPPASIFTSVGALRDDVAIQPRLSTTDRIGKYTRSFPAGTFNRPYTVKRRIADETTASATLVYDAPDVVPNGARFERTVTLDTDEPGFTISQRVTFGAAVTSTVGARVGADIASGAAVDAAMQRAVRYDSFDTRGAALLDDRANGAIGFFYAAPGCGCVATVAWPISDVEDAQLMPQRTSTVLRLRFAPGRETRTRYSIYYVASTAEARAAVLKERTAAAAKR